MVYEPERKLNQTSDSHQSEIGVVSQALQVSSGKPFRKDPGQVTGQQVREASIMHQSDAKKASA